MSTPIIFLTYIIPFRKFLMTQIRNSLDNFSFVCQDYLKQIERRRVTRRNMLMSQNSVSSEIQNLHLKAFETNAHDTLTKVEV